jgi:protein TonB
MIRRSSSLFVSIVIHLILFFGAYFAWSSYLQTKNKYKDEHKEESLSLQLCKLKYEQETLSIKKEPKKVEQPKKPIEPKIKKKIEEAPKPKPNLPQKEIVVEEATPKTQEIQESEVVEEIKREEEKVVALEKSIKTDAREEYLKINTQEISQLIGENLYYPMAARKRNITGRVSVRFTLCADGKVSDVEIIDSSSDILSRAATRTIEELSGKFPKPGIDIILTLPIDYNLN